MTPRRRLRLLCALAWLGVAGCGDGPAPRGAANEPPVRIVSLSPGITATMVAIGAGDLLVGRTPWCLGVDSAEVVGTLLDFDAERLASVSPALILVQPPAQGVSARLTGFAQRRGWRVQTHQLESIADVRALIDRLPGELGLPAGDPRAAAIEGRATQLARGLDECLAPVPAAERFGRALALLSGGESPDLLAFGRDTYLAEALAAMGIAPALDRPGYPALSIEAIVAIHPDTIILVGSRSAGTKERLASLLPDARFVAAAHSGLRQPGGGLIDGLSQLRRELAEAPP